MKMIKNVIIISLILAVVFIGVGFASGATFENVYDSLSSESDYTLQDPIIYTDTITTLNVSATNRNIIVKPSTDDNITINYYEKESETWSISLVDNVLNITEIDQITSSWFNFIWPWSDVLDLVVEVPSDTAFDMILIANSGLIKMNGFGYLGDASLTAYTGSIFIDNIIVNEMDVVANTGSVIIDELNVTTTLSVVVGSGSIDANQISALTSIVLNARTGSVNVTGISTETLTSEVNTGSINLKNVAINQLDLLTSTGSINMTGVDLSNRTLRLKSSTGSIHVNQAFKGTTYNLILSNNTFYINAEATTGSINIEA